MLSQYTTRQAFGMLLPAVACLATMSLEGCTQETVQPPVTVAQLEVQQVKDPNAFTPEAVLLYNVRRVLDGELPAESRLASLGIVEQLDLEASEFDAQLATLLPDAQTPEPLRLAVLTMLVKKDSPGLAPFVIHALPNEKDGKFRAAMENWLLRHPRPEVLSEVVLLWAADSSGDALAEEQHRRLVESITGQSWSQGLLSAINQEAFQARGSALELLARRMPAAQLQRELLALKPATTAAEALQYYIRRFGYLPLHRNELVMAVMAYTSRRYELGQAGILADDWMATSGYQFNIRDLHLLLGIQKDTARHLPPRSEIIVSLASDIAARPHTFSPADTGVAGSLELKDSVARLSMADLANLYLLNGMLSRPRVQAALQVMAEKRPPDQDQGRWGGLIFYEKGLVEARLYPSATAEGDSRYVLSDRLMQDSTNCMAMLTARFGKDVPVGPSKEEIALSDRLNCYGLAISSAGPTSFTAVYYNPDGVTISLGDFPFSSPAKSLEKAP